jgi:hypothetical protein
MWIKNWYKIFILLCVNCVGRNSVVNIATSYGMDGPGIESRWGKSFRIRPHRLCPPPPNLLYNWYRVSFPGIKRPARGVNHPPTSRAEVKEIVALCIYSPSGPSWPVPGRTLPFICKLWRYFCHLSYIHGRVLQRYSGAKLQQWFPVMINVQYRNSSGVISVIYFCVACNKMTFVFKTQRALLFPNSINSLLLRNRLPPRLHRSNTLSPPANFLLLLSSPLPIPFTRILVTLARFQVQLTSNSSTAIKNTLKLQTPLLHISCPTWPLLVNALFNHVL